MPTLTFSVAGSGTGVRQDIDVTGSGHLIKSDAYEAFGGKDEFPSPLAYALAALSSCTQVVGSVVAREQGIAVESWDITVDGDFDPTVLTTGQAASDEHPDTFTAVRLSVTVGTDADQAQVAALGEATEARCPVSRMFVRAGTSVSSTWSARATAGV